MGRTQSALLLLSAFCALGETGCKKKAQLVVGVDAQPSVASQVGKLHVKASVGPNVLVEKDIVPKQGNEKLAALESPFPFEVPLEADPGAQVDVLIEAFRAGPNNTVADTPMLVRRSHAPFIAGAAPKLDRLQLESSCIVGVPGFKGPACTAPQSCAGGRCIDPTLLEEDLEPYVASWATTRPDVCRPADAGAPVVVAGTGATDFAPLADGQTLAPEKGPQGGHHLWIALRMKNLRQAGSVVTLTGEQPGTGLKVPPTSFVFTFEKDSGGFCKLYGLRFQLDNSSTPVTKFLAQPLDVKIQVKDQSGAQGEATIHVNVAANTVG